MAKNKPQKLGGAFYSYRGKFHNIRVTEGSTDTFHTHVPQNLASSGYREYNLIDGTMEELEERMWRNAERK